MAQADQTVQNDTFPTVRADINSNLAALFSNNSGNTAPSTTVAFMDWIDTSGANPVWKKRNSANNAWITVGTIKTSTLELANTLPSQTSNSGKFLTTDGTNASWSAVSLGLPGTLINTQSFTSSGTWTKPGSGTWALIRCWGGGGSGGKGSSSDPGGGGGGGAFVEKLLPLTSLGATETVTIGAGGAAQTAGNTAGNDGGNTTFGSHITAYGGGGGGRNALGGGGGGGGGGGAKGENPGNSELSGAGGADLTSSSKTAGTWFVVNGIKGATPSTSAPVGGAVELLAVLSASGSAGGNGSSVGDPLGISNTSYGGGGGGGGLNTTGNATANKGGNSVFGGGGGGGGANSVTGGNGGTSTYGGNGSAGAIGANTSSAGTQPGGGSGGTEGGNSGAGGAGQCIVYVY